MQISRQTTPPGGGPLGAIAGMTGMSAQVPTVGYEGRVVTSRDQSRTPVLYENSLNVSAPLLKSGPSTLSSSLNVGSFHFSDSVVLSSGREIPDDLYKAEVGINYSYKFGNKKSWGLRGTLGYTGDEFKNDTKSYTINANYSFPGSERSQWVWFLMYSNNSPFGADFPLPGFFYIYRTQKFTGLFGLPIVSLQWTPVNPWTFSFSAFGPQLKTEVSYGAVDRTQIFSGTSWRQQRFILTDRKNDDERLTMEEMNAELGVRQPLWQGGLGELQVGYAFDRSLYAGDGLFNYEGGKALLQSNWYLKAALKAAF